MTPTAPQMGQTGRTQVSFHPQVSILGRSSLHNNPNNPNNPLRTPAGAFHNIHLAPGGVRGGDF